MRKRFSGLIALFVNFTKFSSVSWTGKLGMTFGINEDGIA
jgi:hypothetical protein